MSYSRQIWPAELGSLSNVFVTRVTPGSVVGVELGRARAWPESSPELSRFCWPLAPVVLGEFAADPEAWLFAMTLFEPTLFEPLACPVTAEPGPLLLLALLAALFNGPKFGRQGAGDCRASEPVVACRARH